MLPQSVTTRCRLQTRYEMQTADCRLGPRPDRFALRILLFRSRRICFSVLAGSLFAGKFLVWYVTICHLKTYRVSRSRFAAVIFHQHKHYCGIFLARFFIYFVFNKAARLQAIYLLLTWFARWLADHRKAAMLAAECEDSGRPTFNDGHVLCHLSSISWMFHYRAQTITKIALAIVAPFSGTVFLVT